MSKQTVVSAGHPSADINVTPTRDKDANLGIGRAYRHDANMLPLRSVTVTRGGLTTPQWRQSSAREENKGVLPPSRAMTVKARSGNVDAGAVGLQADTWGLVGVGDAPKAAGPGAMAPVMTIALLAGFLFVAHRLTR